MHTINVNMVRGHSYKIFQHEILSYESENLQIYGITWFQNNQHWFKIGV